MVKRLACAAMFIGAVMVTSAAEAQVDAGPSSPALTADERAAVLAATPTDVLAHYPTARADAELSIASELRGANGGASYRIVLATVFADEIPTWLVAVSCAARCVATVIASHVAGPGAVRWISGALRAIGERTVLYARTASRDGGEESTALVAEVVFVGWMEGEAMHGFRATVRSGIDDESGEHVDFDLRPSLSPAGRFSLALRRGEVEIPPRLRRGARIDELDCAGCDVGPAD